MSRIFDQPDHRNYGPVRRMHVMLLQVYADVGLDGLEEQYEEAYITTWDDSLSWFIEHGLSEPDATRVVMHRCLKCYQP